MANRATTAYSPDCTGARNVRASGTSMFDTTSSAEVAVAPCSTPRTQVVRRCCGTRRTPGDTKARARAAATHAPTTVPASTPVTPSPVAAAPAAPTNRPRGGDDEDQPQHPEPFAAEQGALGGVGEVGRQHDQGDEHGRERTVEVEGRRDERARQQHHPRHGEAEHEAGGEGGGLRCGGGRRRRRRPRGWPPWRRAVAATSCSASASTPEITVRLSRAATAPRSSGESVRFRTRNRAYARTFATSVATPMTPAESPIRRTDRHGVDRCRSGSGSAMACRSFRGARAGPRVGGG